MNHKDLSTESAAGTIATQTESRHYSFRHQHRHLWHCAWVWILIISFLTPQFSYNTEAKNLLKKITDETWRVVTNVHDAVEKNVIRPLAQEFVPDGLRSTWDHSVGKGFKEAGRVGHKIEKYTTRPVSDPKLIGKVAVMAIVTYYCPPALGTWAGAGGILAAGAASATYDRVVLNVHNGGDLTRSFLTAAGSAAVTAAFNEYWPTEVKIEVTDPVTGVTQTVTEKVVLSTSEQYLRGVAMSMSHIAVSQAAEYIVHGKDGNFLEGGALSGAIVGAFVPSVSMLTGVDDTTFALGGIEIAGSSIVPSVDAFARSVVEQSVANKFNMKKVDFGSAVASGAQALRDQYVREKATEFAKFAKNWYESKQVKSYAQGEIDADKDDLGMGDNPAINNDDRNVTGESYAEGEIDAGKDDLGMGNNPAISNGNRKVPRESYAQGEIDADKDDLGMDDKKNNENTVKVSEFFEKEQERTEKFSVEKFFADMNSKGAYMYVFVDRPFLGLIPNESGEVIHLDDMKTGISEKWNMLKNHIVENIKYYLRADADIIGHSSIWSLIADDNQKPWHGHIAVFDKHGSIIGNIGVDTANPKVLIFEPIDKNLKDIAPAIPGLSVVSAPTAIGVTAGAVVGGLW